MSKNSKVSKLIISIRFHSSAGLKISLCHPSFNGVFDGRQGSTLTVLRLTGAITISSETMNLLVIEEVNIC